MRDGALYCYNMFAYIDGDFMAKAVAMMTQPDGKAKVQAAAKDGIAASGPRQARRDPQRLRRPLPVHALLLAEAAQPPDSMESLFELNDVELFDLAAGPA